VAISIIPQNAEGIATGLTALAMTFFTAFLYISSIYFFLI